MTDRARANTRLAWLIVGISAVVTLALVTLLAGYGWRQANRWAEQEWARTQAENAARRRALAESAEAGDLSGDPLQAANDRRLARLRMAEQEARRAGLNATFTVPPSPPPPDTAKPIGRPSQWLSADDYPGGALRNGEEGLVRVTLAVDRGGIPTGCSVRQSSGSASLDNGTCLAMMAKGRFEPERRAPMVRHWTSPIVRWQLPH